MQISVTQAQGIVHQPVYSQFVSSFIYILGTRYGVIILLANGSKLRPQELRGLNLTGGGRSSSGGRAVVKQALHKLLTSEGPP